MNKMETVNEGADELTAAIDNLKATSSCAMREFRMKYAKTNVTSIIREFYGSSESDLSYAIYTTPEVLKTDSWAYKQEDYELLAHATRLQPILNGLEALAADVVSMSNLLRDLYEEEPLVKDEPFDIITDEQLTELEEKIKVIIDIMNTKNYMGCRVMGFVYDEIGNKVR